MRAIVPRNEARLDRGHSPNIACQGGRAAPERFPANPTWTNLADPSAICPPPRLPCRQSPSLGTPARATRGPGITQQNPGGFRPMYFEIVRASGGYRAHIRGRNHELIFWTEVYATKASARHAINLVKDYATNAQIYDRT